MKKSPAGSDEQSSLLAILVSAGSLGLTLFICLCLGIAAGYWLDKELGTTPWLLIIGGLLGALSGFWSLYKKGLRYMQQSSAQGRKPHRGGK